MAFWNKPPASQLPEWDMAKKISKEEAQEPNLPLGWYIYQDESIWCGLRPNEARTGLERSYFKHSPEDLEEWLGKPIPAGIQRPKEMTVEEIVAQALQETQPVRAEASEEPTEVERKKEVNRKRSNQIHFYLSDRELVWLRKRVRLSGLNQSEFIRQALLKGTIQVKEVDFAQMELIDSLSSLRAEMGRIGGMMKMVIKPNEGQRELAPQQWQELIHTIRYLERTKERLTQLLVKLNGKQK